MGRHMAVSFGGQAGELIEETSLFNFDGVDVTGNQWTAEGVDASGGNYSAEFCVVQGSIDFLTSKRGLSGNSNNSLHQMYFEHPCFPSPPFSGIAPELEFVCGESSVSLSKGKPACDVAVRGGELSDEFAKAVEKTLNVLSGVRLQLGVAEKIWADHHVVELYSMDTELSNQPLVPPIEIPVQSPSEFYGNIFSHLVNFFQQNGSVYYDNWYKLNRAWQAGLESAALNVSVCIEGVLKAYFLPLGSDKEFAELCQHAVPVIMQLEVSDRVRNLLRSCLGGSGHFKPKTALRALTDSGEISNELAGKWNKLRSETAHAVVAGEAREDWQRMVDLTFANIKLFYEILFSIVGYAGERIDYEVRGFPSKLPSVKKTAPDQTEG